MVRDGLTRKQLAERRGASSDRITQWLCILKLPDEKLKRIAALGDHWDRPVVTERTLRRIRLSAISLGDEDAADLELDHLD